MIRYIKQLFCQHKWKILRKPSVWVEGYYGCVSCGKVDKVWLHEKDVWKFDREMRGDGFIDDY